jgi:hypothetical protein
MFQVSVFCFDRNQYIACRSFKTWRGAHAHLMKIAGTTGVNTSVSITDFTIV